MNRRFKVMELGCSYGSSHVQGAELRFRGHWLKRAGFHPGSTLTLTNPEPGILHLRIDGPAQLTAKDFTAAIEPFARLGI